MSPHQNENENENENASANGGRNGDGSSASSPQTSLDVTAPSQLMPAASSLMDLVRHGQISVPAEQKAQRRFLRFFKRAASNRQFMNQIEHLRDRLILSAARERETAGGRVIAVTGPRGGEGTSLIHLMLGMALGECSQRRVAILDGHFDQLRHEAISQMLGLSKNGLQVEGSTSDVVAKYNHHCPNTYFLNSSDARGSVQFFSDRRLDLFFSNARQHFDFTLIDMPPLLESSANAFVLPYVDRLYLVVEAGKTRVADVERCQTTAREAGTAIHGIVINKQKIPFWARLFWRDFFF